MTCNNYSTIPKSEINTRISNLKVFLQKNDCEAALLLSIPELYYYSGFGADGAIYVPVEGSPVHLVKRNKPFAQEYSQISELKLFGRRSKIFETLEVPPKARVAIEKEIVPSSIVDHLESLTNSIELVNGSFIFRNIRSIKSKFEIDQIEQAATLVDESFEYCTEIANSQMTEIELASKLNTWLLHNGHNGYINTYAFNTALVNYSYVISSHSSVLNTYFTPISGYGLSLKYPYGPSRQKLGKNRPFVIDSCGNHLGYISDTTRTFICGHFDEETRDQLRALIQIKEFIYKNLKPKINLGELYTEVMNLSKELKIEKQFMGTNQDRVAFIGHGVGLTLDDLPVFYSKGPDLVQGNVLACEPKLFVQNEKILGIEDNSVITSNGNRLLTKSPNYFEIS